MRPFENFVFQSLPILVPKATLHSSSNRSSKNDINFIRDTTATTTMKRSMAATATAAAIQVKKNPYNI